MTEDIINAQYDISKKSKLKKFYDNNIIIIYSLISILIITFVSLYFYFKNIEKNKIILSEKFVQAKIHLNNEEKDKATEILKRIIYDNDSTYSTLSFFLILNQNLISDYNELSKIFDYLLDNNDFDEEVKNLLIYKKALFNSDQVTESKLLEDLKPILNSKSLWKPHALLLLGDYFFQKGEHIKAKEFYGQILTIDNLKRDLFEQVILQLSLIEKK